jgi:hypothetical protein
VNAYTYGENLSWQLARHTLKFGVQALRYQQNRYYSSNDGALGWFLYQGAATAGSTGDTWGDFLQNRANSSARVLLLAVGGSANGVMLSSSRTTSR